MKAEIADIAQRLANVIRIGRVAEVDHAQVRVRITFDGNKTRWLPWMTGRAGATRDWNPPAVGEQVAVISPSGNLGAGFILPGGINWTQKPAPGSDGDTTKTVFADGTTVEQNASAKTYKVEGPSGSTLTLKVGTSQIVINESGITISSNGKSLALSSGGFNMTGDLNQTGAHTSSGDQIAGGISQKTHKHSGVQSGPSLTGTPV